MRRPRRAGAGAAPYTAGVPAFVLRISDSVKPPTSTPENLRQAVSPEMLRAEQCLQLMRSLPRLALWQLLMALGCAWLLFGRMPSRLLFGWLAAVALSQVAAPLLWRLWPHADERDGVPGPLACPHRVLRVGAMLSGLPWGVLPWLVPQHRMLDGVIGFAVACVGGGVAAGIGFDLVAALAFAAAAMLPLVAWGALQHTPLARLQALFGTAWLVFVALLARAAQQRLARGQLWRARALREAARRERQMQRSRRLARLGALLAEIGRIGAEADDIEDFEHAVCRVAVQRAGMSQAWIAHRDAASSALQVRAQCNSAGTADAALHGREQAAYACRDLQACYAGADGGEAGSVAALPLLADGKAPAGNGVIGVLVLCMADVDGLDAVTTEVLDHVGAAVERALHALFQRRRMIQLQSLYHALMSEGDVLLQARNVQEMLSRTCQTLAAGTPFHAVWVARPDEQGRIEVVARAGSGADQLDALRISLHDQDQSPLVIQAWTRQRDACSNDLLGDPAMAPWRPSMSAHGWRSALAVPVFRAGAIWAVLVFVSPQARAFEPQTTELCQRVAELLGHGLDELDTKRRLSDLQLEESHRARHDLLTSLPNRFALTQYLPRALAGAREDGSVLAVGMIDLDDFKPVNDTWGHAAGDRLLREFAQRMRAAVRKFDVLARLGGDEFVVIIEQIDAEQVLGQLGDVLRRLHTAVQSPFELAPDCRVRVGMTMGIALYPLDGEDPDALVRQADAAMYQAKLHKHDRTQWWQLAAASGDRLGSVAQRREASAHSG